MERKQKTLDCEVPGGHYRAKFRCPNCGIIFERDIQLAKAALGAGGDCVNCGVKDGAAGIGNFTVIKYNDFVEQPTDSRRVLME